LVSCRNPFGLDDSSESGPCLDLQLQHEWVSRSSATATTEQKGTMEIATRLSNEIARYLDLDTRQIQLTSANMANIDTPGYRAAGMSGSATSFCSGVPAAGR
jgi:hypothetical protein